MTKRVDRELAAIATILSAMEWVHGDARERVLWYVTRRLNTRENKSPPMEHRGRYVPAGKAANEEGDR